MSKWCDTCYKWKVTGEPCSCKNDCPIFGKHFEELAEEFMKIMKESENMKTLLIINFETGDASCKYWEIPIVIDGSFDYETLEDSFSSYFDSNYDDDGDYDTHVRNVMDVSGLKWEMNFDKFTCNRIMQMYI